MAMLFDVHAGCLRAARRSAAVAVVVLGLGGAGCSSDGASSGGGAGAAGTAGTGGTPRGGSGGNGTGGSGGASPSASGEIFALTYNVAGLPEALTGAPDPLTRMPLIGELLNDYDLVLTQEDWLTPDPNPLAPTRVYHELLEEAATHPFRSIPLPVPLGADPDHWPATADRAATAALVSDGLNEFSTIEFDPAAVEHVTWHDCYGDASVGAGDCLATKGFTVATHTLAAGVEVDVYDLHGEAGRTALDLPLMRADFEQLAAFINDPVRTGRAILLAGDTNLHTERPVSDTAPDAEIWQTFLDATGLTDVCDTEATDIACELNRDGGLIDKFAFRSNDVVLIEAMSHEFETAKFTYPGGYLSDHDPLSVRFAWTQR